tara:strand:+ start:551 stop:1240 length:690 start_codon:yes stop_codon:yes gene_type:complete
MILKSSSQIENEFIKSYFGSWIEQIDLILEEMKEVLKSDKKSKWEKELSEKFPGWTWAGSGAFRWVLSPSDPYVIKFAQSGSNHNDGIKLNKMESERQLEFEGLFPKVYFHHPNWEWIAVEKVRPAMPDDLQSFFKISRDGAYNFSHLLSYHVAIISGNKRKTERKQREGLISNSGFKEDYEKLLTNITFRRMANVARKLNLWEFDLSWGNLGINEKGKLVILDSSLPI